MPRTATLQSGRRMAQGAVCGLAMTCGELQDCDVVFARAPAPAPAPGQGPAALHACAPSSSFLPRTTLLRPWPICFSPSLPPSPVPPMPRPRPPSGVFAFHLWACVRARLFQRTQLAIVQYTVLLVLFGVSTFRAVAVPFLAASLLGECYSVAYLMGKLLDLAGAVGPRERGAAGGQACVRLPGNELLAQSSTICAGGLGRPLGVGRRLRIPSPHQLLLHLHLQHVGTPRTLPCTAVHPGVLCAVTPPAALQQSPCTPPLTNLQASGRHQSACWCGVRSRPPWWPAASCRTPPWRWWWRPRPRPLARTCTGP